MYLLSYTLKCIVTIYLLNSRACYAIQVVGHEPAVSTRRQDGTTFVSSTTFDQINGNGGEEYIVTSPDSQSDTTVNAPTLDIGCRGGTVKHTCLNTSAGPDSTQENPFVITVINRVQLAVTCAGFLANGAIYLTLSYNGGRLSMLILLVIKHQSFVDMGVCGMGALYLLLPARNWLTGNRIADFAICHTWHNQGLFWADMFVSTWNLVLIGVERYIMICKPIIHNSVTKRQFLYTFAGIYVGSFILLITAYMQVNFVNGECLRRDMGHQFYSGFGIVNICVYYFLPVVAFVFIYGRMLMTLRKRLKSSTLPSSKVIETANSLMTKTGVAVTAIFVLTIGYVVIYYILGEIGVGVYTLNSPLQKIGLLLSAFNSAANPFVYVLLMPAFRDSLRKTFHLPTLRCAIVNKRAVVEGSPTESDTTTGGTGQRTIDTTCQALPETCPASPKHVAVEMNPVSHIASPLAWPDI